MAPSPVAGKFEPIVGAGVNDNDGFGKLGAYGFDNVAKKYRFLLDFDHDGISDLRIVSAFQLNWFRRGRRLCDGPHWYAT